MDSNSTVRTAYMSAYYQAQLWYNVQQRTVLMISLSILQIIITPQMSSVGRQTNQLHIKSKCCATDETDLD